MLLSLTLLPAAFYAFARRWGMDGFASVVCAAAMTAALFLNGGMLGTWNFGSDLRSILGVGLVANTVSLPFLFAFMANFGREHQGNGWKLPALLLGALLLLHPLSSLVALMFVAADLLGRVWQLCTLRRMDWKTPALSVGVGGLIGSAWVFPFVSHRAFMAGGYTPPLWSPAIIAILFLGLLPAFASIFDGALRPLGLFYILLLNFVMAGEFWQLNLEFTRLTIYLLLMIPVLVVVRVRSRSLLLGIAGLAVLVGCQGYRQGRFDRIGVPDFPLPDFGRVEGRILSVAHPGHVPSPRVQHELIPLRTRNLSVMGLFIQSSPNGWFLAELSRALEPAAQVSGAPGAASGVQPGGLAAADYIRERLRLFDIRHVFTDLRLERILDPDLAGRKRYITSYPIDLPADPVALESLRARYNIRDRRAEFYLYGTGDSALAEPLAYLPGLVETGWEAAARKWFVQASGLPVFTDRPLPPGARPARAGESVELIAASARMDRLVLRINAQQDIPVLVKVGYFPAWHLTVDGRESAVYRASPNLIVVCGHGDAVLEYRRPWQEYAGLGLAAAGLAALLLL